jgi:hypothetical protein
MHIPSSLPTSSGVSSSWAARPSYQNTLLCLSILVTFSHRLLFHPQHHLWCHVAIAHAFLKSHLVQFIHL